MSTIPLLPPANDASPPTNITNRIVRMTSSNRVTSNIPKDPERHLHESAKPAMRRLSSLASINKLNLFTRRRSHVFTDTSSSPVREMDAEVRPDHYTDFDPTLLVEDRKVDVKKVRPSDMSTEDKLHFNKRASWIPVPEKSAEPLPRSRTLSNLPIPLKSRRTSQIQASQSITKLPPSRIPTPTGLTRSIRSRLPSGPKSLLKTARNKGIVRSDTEPLLTSRGEAYTPAKAKLTAFKENLSPTPVKTTSNGTGKINAKHPPTVSDFETLNHKLGKSLQRSSSSAHRNTRGLHERRNTNNLLPKLDHLEEPSTYQSSLGDHDLTALPEIPPGQWQGERKSFGGDIKQYQLLSPKNAESISTPETPISSGSIVAQKFKSGNNSGPIRERLEASPCSYKSVPTPIALPDPDKVYGAEPVSYWCGRFSSLNDRMRSERFEELSNNGESFLGSLETVPEKRRRFVNVMKTLYSRCENEEARFSFQTFHAYMRTMHARSAAGDEEAIAAFISWTDIIGPFRSTTGGKDLDRKRRDESVESGASDLSLLTMSSTRKATFMERLLGRTRLSVGQA